MDTNSISKIREPIHAPSWYSNNPQLLNNQMDGYLSRAKREVKPIAQIKAIIGPHAGFDYSAPTAAWAYQYLTPSENLRVFLLGPCHHTYIKGIGLSQLDSYRTPLGDILLDRETIDQIAKEIKGYVFTNKEIEEEEHSLELHLPYIQKMLKEKPFKLVPIMVGQTDPKQEEQLGKYLRKFFDDKNTLFIISSDFCHWGKRFQYTPCNVADGHIHQYIEKLDRRAIELIEKHDTKGYYAYLDETENTICGRHPIGILLQIINNNPQLKTLLTSYAQSGRITKPNESSVSYTSMITYI